MRLIPQHMHANTQIQHPTGHTHAHHYPPPPPPPPTHTPPNPTHTPAHLRDGEGEGGVRGDGARRERGKGGAALVGQNARHQGDLKGGGDHVEDHGAAVPWRYISGTSSKRVGAVQAVHAVAMAGSMEGRTPRLPPASPPQQASMPRPADAPPSPSLPPLPSSHPHLRIKLIPRVPRSMARDTAPVWRDRWKPRSMPCRWPNTLAATERMAPWVTCGTRRRRYRGWRWVKVGMAGRRWGGGGSTALERDGGAAALCP